MINTKESMEIHVQWLVQDVFESTNRQLARSYYRPFPRIFSTLEMDKLGQIRRHHWKERLW